MPSCHTSKSLKLDIAFFFLSLCRPAGASVLRFPFSVLLHFQKWKWNRLFGDGEEGGEAAGLEGAGHTGAGDVGLVAFLGEVGEDERAQ